MKWNSKQWLYALCVPVVLFAVTCVPASAQSLYDGVVVTLPYTVSVGATTLQPGEYVMRRLEQSPLVVIYGDQDGKYQGLAWFSIDAGFVRATRSEVALLHTGDRYVLDSISIRGESESILFLPARPQHRRAKERALASNYVTLPIRPALAR